MAFSKTGWAMSSARNLLRTDLNPPYKAPDREVTTRRSTIGAGMGFEDEDQYNLLGRVPAKRRGASYDLLG